MAWPVTINGNTYQASDFSPYGYVVSFPAIIGDVATTAGQVAADRATVATDKGVVAADRVAVAADKAIVAADKLTVYNDRLLADAGALTASKALGLLADATDSYAISTGDKTFTVPAGKSFAAGMPLRVSSKANPDTQFMTGVVKSYSGTTLVFAAQTATGSATRADWTIAVTGGALAPFGATQDAQAIARYAEKIDALRAAAVPDRPNLLFDFLESTFFVRGAYAGASMLALVAALSGSTYARASTATYFGADGLLKTAAINEPRFDCDPVTKQALGLLIEPARTNLVTYSEQIDNAAWSKVRASIAANAATAPDGTTTADKIIEDSSASTSHFARVTATIVAGAVSTGSIFVKAAERGFAHVSLLNPATPFEGVRVMVDLATGATGALDQANGASGGEFLITNAGNGWWRVSVSGLLGSATSIRLDVFSAINATASGNFYTGDGASGIYAWGAQIEAGSAPTSYIPTVASTVTRAADDVALVLPGLLNQAEGTLLFESGPVVGGYIEARIMDPSQMNFVGVRRTNTHAGQMFAFKSGVGIAGVTPLAAGSFPAGGGRMAARYKLSDYAASANAAAVVKAAPASVPDPGMDRLRIIATGPAAIRRIIYVPAALSDAKLQTLSNLTSWS